MILSAIPLILIPISIPISNELQFTLSNLLDISPKQLSSAAIFILAAISVSVFLILLNRKQLTLNSAKVIGNIYYPVLIATICMFNFHRHYVWFGYFDHLELCDYVLCPQQLFQFGKIPFVDIFAPRGFSDIAWTTLYSLINGYRGLEIIMWDLAIAMLIFAILLYFVIKNLANPVFSLLTVIFLPVLNLLSPLYIIGLLPALCLYRLIKKPIFFNFCIFWLSVLFASIWLPSFAPAAFFSSVFILIGYHLNNKNIDWRRSILSFLIITAPAFLIYILLHLLKNKPFIDSLILIQSCTDFECLIGSYEKIISEYNPLAVFFYFIFPLISCAYIIFFLLKSIRNEKIYAVHYMMTFLAIFSLIFSFRGLLRHCLKEKYVTYYFILLAVSYPFLFNKIKKSYSQLIFLSLFLAYQFAFPGYRGILRQGRFYEFKHWHNKESRTLISTDRQYRDLAAFLNHHLTPEQTFFDFINAPLLYTLTEREMPFLHFAVFIAYSDPPQKVYVKQFKNFYDKNRIPFVIFKSSEWRWWAIGSIPNAVAAYRVAEFIYQHYRPYGNVGDYQIWVANNHDKSILEEKEKAAAIEKKYDFTPIDNIQEEFVLEKLPYIWGTYDSKKAAVKTKILETIVEHRIMINADDKIKLDFNPNIDKSSGNYLHLRLRSDKKGVIKVKYGKDPKAMLRFLFDVIPSKKFEDYIVRVSCQWHWMNEEIRRIVIIPNVPVEIEKIFIRKGD